jgi:hypothetical protein
MRGERGVGLLQTLIVVAVLGLILGISLPAVSGAVRSARMRAAAFEMVSSLRWVRHRAIAEAKTLGLVFRRDGEEYDYSLHMDGDGDGLLTRDVRRGVDPLLEGPDRLSRRYEGVRPGFPPVSRVRRIPPARGFLRDLGDPVRFGNTEIVSCSATGRCSSGTLYLTDGQDRLWAIVLYGVTGRMRVYRYDAEAERWRR